VNYFDSVIFHAFLIIFIIFIFSFPLAYSSTDPKELESSGIDPSLMVDLTEYTPEVTEVKIVPDPPLPNESIKIFARVIDKYGEVLNGTLSYSTGKWNTSNNIKMRLINGIYSNGTYLATIPGQEENTTVDYRLYFKDNLGYSYNYTNQQYIVPVLSNDTTPPNFVDVGAETGTTIRTPTELYAQIEDNSISNLKTLKNVTIFYFTSSNQTISNRTIFYFTSSNQTISNRTMTYDVINYNYMGSIDPFFRNTTLLYWIKACDYSNNCNTKPQITEPPKILNITSSQAESEIDNSIIINTNILNIDVANMSSRFEIQVGSGNLDGDKIPHIPFIQGENFDYNNNKSITNMDIFELPLKHITLKGDPDIVRFSSERESEQVSLFGNPETYPFDTYNLNLVLAIPVSNINITEGTSEIDESVMDNWEASDLKVSEIDNKNSTIRNLLKKCKNDTGNFSSSFLCISYLRDNGNSASSDEYSFAQIQIGFHRNYTILAIIIPIIAIFFLLGAIFILDIEELGNRLTLSLGVFALIFTLPDVIERMKPQILQIPSVAESLISIIIISTIAFTVSSIISNVSSIKQHPTAWIWIDRIIFFGISGIIIYYMVNYRPDLTIWLLPLILFGLGYGLLVRIFKGKEKTSPSKGNSKRWHVFGTQESKKSY
jgi:hypothetical protein